MLFCLFLIVKNKILDKTYFKILLTSLETFYCQECSNKSESTSISTIDIVIGGDHSQCKCRSVSKFILRFIHIKKLKSYVIKKVNIDCNKHTYGILNELIIHHLMKE